MTCESCQMACYDLLDGSLPPQTERDVREHLGHCAACREFYEWEKRCSADWPVLFALPGKRRALSAVARGRVLEAARRIKGMRLSRAWGFAAAAACLAVLVGGAFLLHGARHSPAGIRTAKFSGEPAAEGSLPPGREVSPLSGPLSVAVEKPVAQPLLAESPALPRVADAAPDDKEKKMRMNRITENAAAAMAVAAGAVLAPVVPALASASGGNETGTSAAIAVVTDSGGWSFWRTLPSDHPVIQWEWPAGATSATLTASGMSVIVSGVILAPTNSATVNLPAPSIPGGTEDVYVFTLAFNNGQKLVSPPLGNVTGRNGAATHAVLTSELGDRPWNRPYPSAVLAVDADAPAIILDGKTVDTGLAGAAGWYCWHPIKVGTHTAQTVLDGAEVTRSLVRFNAGTVVMLK